MKEKNEQKLLLIIPAYNESEGIVDVIKDVDAYRESCGYH